MKSFGKIKRELNDKTDPDLCVTCTRTGYECRHTPEMPEWDIYSPHLHTERRKGNWDTGAFGGHTTIIKD